MPEHMIILEGGPHHGREISLAARQEPPGTITVPWMPPTAVAPPVPARPSWWRHPVRWYRWQAPAPWTPPDPQFRQFAYRDSGQVRGNYLVYKTDDSWEGYKGPEVHPSAEGDDLYHELCSALFAVPARIRADKGTRWVMTLDWYKRLRRELPWLNDSADESTWVPGPADTLLAKPIEVREDGGAPHIESPGYPAA